MRGTLGAFGIAILLVIALAPITSAELIYGQEVDDAPPFWAKLFSTQSGYFYDANDPGDVYCRATRECVKTSDGKYKFDCYSSGGSGTGCLCYATTDSSKCAINQPTTTSTQATSTAVSTFISSLCSDGEQRCSGSVAQMCYKSQWTTATDCSKTGASCVVYAGKTSCLNFQTGASGATCSPTKLCSDPTKICDTDSGTCVDFLSNPNIWLNNIQENAEQAETQATQSTSSTFDKVRDFLTGGGSTTTKQRDITDAEVKELDEGSLLYIDAEKIKAETTCVTDSSCQSNHCVSFQKAGITTNVIQKYTLGQIFGVCYSGSGTVTPPPTDIPGSSKSLSLTFKEWQDTSAAQRLKTLCKTNDDCAPYSDVEGTGKEFSVSCNAARTSGQLQDDVAKVCESTGSDKYIALGGGAAGFAVGCLAGAAQGAAIGAAATIAIGGVGGTLTAVPGCIIGGLLAGTVVVATVEGVHNTIQVDCKKKTIPSDAGACIATPKGGITGLDSLKEEYNLFGVTMPLWLIIVLAIIVLVIVLSLAGGGKK